jgi:ABC-2 type transport system permease protein
MKKVFLVLRHELLTTVRRPSFLLVAFGIPLLAILALLGVTIFRGNSSGSGVVPSDAAGATELEVQGYVDERGLISVIPRDIPRGYLVAYPDEQQALAAMEAGEITAYYLVPKDYVETGNLVIVSPDPSPFPQHQQDWVMRWTLLVNVLGGDAELAQRVMNPVNLRVTDLTPEPQNSASGDQECSKPGMTCEPNLLIRYLPMIMLVLFYIFITTGSSLLLRSISAEKENRVMEILMLSLSPLQVLAGKIIGLGIAGFLQMAAWVGTVYVSLRIGGQTLNLPPGSHIPPSLLIWGLVFFLLGYAVYASLMAGAGALVPTLKETTQATWVVMLPIFAGYLVGLFLIEEPHGMVATGLSLFPLTSPVLMIMRLTIGGVPVWQPPLAAGLLALTAVFVVRLVARMFHAQNLLSGQSFSVRRFYGALLGRA